MHKIHKTSSLHFKRITKRKKSKKTQTFILKQTLPVTPNSPTTGPSFVLLIIKRTFATILLFKQQQQQQQQSKEKINFSTITGICYILFICVCICSYCSPHYYCCCCWVSLAPYSTHTNTLIHLSHHYTTITTDRQPSQPATTNTPSKNTIKKKVEKYVCVCVKKRTSCHCVSV